MGVLQVALTQRSEDYVRGDVTYYELARSILEGRPYGFDGRLETLLPPGFPAILAALCALFGSRYTVLIRSMPIFATLAFIVSYEFLRRLEGRRVAAAICLLLISSVEVFRFSTTLVFSDLPYFLASALALLLVHQLDEGSGARRSAGKWLLLCFLLPASVMLRSAGITLLVGLAAWLAVSWLRTPSVATKRLRMFAPPLLLGLLVLAGWMEWGRRHEVSEWPIGGYPRSYLSQLLLKSGNVPELGSATLTDVGARVWRNAVERAANTTELLARWELTRASSSPAVFIPLVLVAVGLAVSINGTSGALHDWYYLAHEAMYLLWPWNFEERFFLPVIPLTCLYLWRGGRVVLRLAQTRSRAFGRGLLPVAVLLGGASVAWLRRAGGAQAALSVAFWISAAAFGSWLAGSGSGISAGRIGRWAERARRPPRWMPLTHLSLVQLAAVTGLVALFGLGVADQLKIGDRNLHFDLAQTSSFPSVQAATWIRTHSVDTDAVMARERELVYHYSGRRVVWFPPISDPAVLMDGIHRHAVTLIVVTDGRFDYWLPTDRTCFERLVAAYPEAFYVVHEDPRYEIFSLAETALSDPAPRGQSPALPPAHLRARLKG
jgi:hypothetical protein